MRAFVVPVCCLIVTACASGGASSGDALSSTYDFRAIRTAYVQTPIQVRLRTGGGGDVRQLENIVADGLREYLRITFGWTAARTPQEADVIAHFQLTDWESGGEGTRVGGAIILGTTSHDTVFSAATVYPSRFAMGAPGQPQENLPRLFDTLFRPLHNLRREQ